MDCRKLSLARRPPTVPPPATAAPSAAMARVWPDPTPGALSPLRAGSAALGSVSGPPALLWLSSGLSGFVRLFAVPLGSLRDPGTEPFREPNSARPRRAPPLLARSLGGATRKTGSGGANQKRREPVTWAGCASPESANWPVRPSAAAGVRQGRCAWEDRRRRALERTEQRGRRRQRLTAARKRASVSVARPECGSPGEAESAWHMVGAE